MQTSQLPNSVVTSLLKLVNYSLEDIGYEYKALTENEKALVTEEEFYNVLKAIQISKQLEEI